MLELASGWTLDIERGPDGLFVRLHGPASSDVQGTDLAEYLWLLLRQHFSNRLVLEMDQLPILHSCLPNELIRLQERISQDGGLLRLSGLSEGNRRVLRTARLSDWFPQYGCREDAVMERILPARPRLSGVC